MNENKIENLRKKVKSLQGKEIYITFEGAISLSLTISDPQFLITNERIIISYKTDIIIDFNNVEDIEIINHIIKIKISGDVVMTID